MAVWVPDLKILTFIPPKKALPVLASFKALGMEFSSANSTVAKMLLWGRPTALGPFEILTSVMKPTSYLCSTSLKLKMEAASVAGLIQIDLSRRSLTR